VYEKESRTLHVLAPSSFGKAFHATVIFILIGDLIGDGFKFRNPDMPKDACP
jgi:hypothetical protein